MPSTFDLMIFVHIASALAYLPFTLIEGRNCSVAQSINLQGSDLRVRHPKPIFVFQENIVNVEMVQRPATNKVKNMNDPLKFKASK